MLLVQEYLLSGKSLEDLNADHGVKHHITNGKISLNYDQIESSSTDRLASQCRGLILREGTWDVVACPMFRFFNMDHEGVAANIDWESASFEEKLDGSCIIAYFDHVMGKWCCATRGRAEADGPVDDQRNTFAALVEITINAMWYREHPMVSLDCAYSLDSAFKQCLGDEANDYTFVFELTSIFNRIVCQYNEPSLTLLAVRNNETLQEDDPAKWIGVGYGGFGKFGISIPDTYSFDSIEDMVTVIRTWDPKEHEGVVVKDKHFNRVKVKNPAYVAYNHMRDSLITSFRGCVEIVLLGKDDDVVAMMPPIIANRIRRIKPAVKQVLEQTQKDYDELKHIEDKKEFALQAKERLWPGALFALHNGKTPDLHTFALGNKKDQPNIPTGAVKTMLNLCKTIDPEIGKLDIGES